MEYFVNKYLHVDKYHSYERPGVNEGIPTTIYVDLYILTLSGIDVMNMEFMATIHFRQRWQDTRLAFQELHDDYVTLNFDLVPRLWIPDTYFDVVKSAHVNDVTSPNRGVRVYPQGEIFYSQAVTLKLECGMNLYKFPMDTQECEIKIASYGLTTRDCLIEWRDIPEPIQINEQLLLPELDLTGVKNDSYTNSYMYITGSFSYLVVKLQFHRKFNYYLLQVYLPSVLVVTVSWVGFWIDADAVPARVSLGLLTALTMITHVSSANARQPHVSYVKALDVWMTACIFFVFGSLIEYCVVNVFYRREQRWNEESRMRETILSVIKDTATTQDIRGDQNGDNSRHNASEATPVDLTRAKPCSTHGLPVWASTGSQPDRKSSRVDDVSKFMFPISFLLFNVVYWVMYLIVL